jgi:hypothetical protein
MELYLHYPYTPAWPGAWLSKETTVPFSTVTGSSPPNSLSTVKTTHLLLSFVGKSVSLYFDHIVYL